MTDKPIHYLDQNGFVRTACDDRRYRDRDDRVAALVRSLFKDARFRGQ